MLNCVSWTGKWDKGILIDYGSLCMLICIQTQEIYGLLLIYDPNSSDKLKIYRVLSFSLWNHIT